MAVAYLGCSSVGQDTGEGALRDIVILCQHLHLCGELQVHHLPREEEARGVLEGEEEGRCHGTELR